MIKPRFYNKWHKLTDVMLGTTYPDSYYQGLPNTIRDPLLKVTEETLQDLDNFENILKQFGCNVLRPNISQDMRIKDWIDDGNVEGIFFSQAIRPPLQVRDAQVVIGDKLVYVSPDNKDIMLTLKQHIAPQDILVHPYLIGRYKKDQHVMTPYGPGALFGPSITVIGKHIFVDRLDEVKANVFETSEAKDKNIQWLKNKFKDFTWHDIELGGHTDAQWAMIKPGVVLSLPGIDNFQNKLSSDYDVLELNETDWDMHKQMRETKMNVEEGKWWIPGEESNLQLIKFIDNWLQNWTGQVYETVFDLNVLVLDEHHVCINRTNETLTKFLRKHNMEPIVVPLRHRFFWDGGLHCITLDLRREGEIDGWDQVLQSDTTMKLTIGEAV